MPDQWKEISDLYHAALGLPVRERAAFLQTCIASDHVRREVASLLAHENKGEALLRAPALEVAGRMMAKENHSDSPRSSTSMIGKTVSHYHIVDKIGQGGMGEVYQAKDLTLGRDVAIKVLPEEFAVDTDRVARFQREAKLLASLNHPNIAAIYGLETSDTTNFLVLELVEGETLADRLKRGLIPVEESLKLALQIAEALEAAHEKGVIHRDLKPANLKVTPDGKVKVLDFGLAKAFAGEQAELNLSNSPTLSDAATQQGVILGTAAYMSPEQARGKAVDKRTDIWAFGCVFFEMITGRAAFSGKDVTDILAAVIRSEPEWSSLPGNLHWRLREVIERCLKKEMKERYHDISDVRVDIQSVLTDPSGMFAQPIMAAEARRKLRTILPWAAATLVLGLIIAGLAVWNLKPSEPSQVMRSEFYAPEDQQLSGDPQTLAVSLDGKQFVYSSPRGLYLRFLKEFDAKLIIGTDTNPDNPFFSPDGKWIGYFSRADGKLKEIAINGGAPVALCDASNVIGASWDADDKIVYADLPKGISRVSANGGTPELIIKGWAFYPQLLPDGKSLLFTFGSSPPFKTIVQSLQSGERKELFTGETARYISTGHIVYVLGNNLSAVPFNLKTLKVTGGSVPVVEGVWRSRAGVSQYAVSDSGTLVYIPGMVGSGASAQRTLAWVDRKGKEQPLAAQPSDYHWPHISPDGTKLALGIITGDFFAGNAKSDIWIWDLVRETMTRLTFEGGDLPLWTRDGRRVAFAASQDPNNDNADVFWKAADGTGGDEKLGSVQGRSLYPWSWSRDGKILVTHEWSRPGTDIGSLSMEGDHKWRPLLQEKYNVGYPKISPDGRWMAYASNESGKYEIYVRPFPDVNKGKSQVSTSGGNTPLWSPDGRELFYRNGDSVMAVAVEAGQTFKCGRPEPLFRGTYTSAKGSDGHPWDISPDGKRFLMMKEAESAASAAGGPRKINIVVNFFEELKQRVPAK